MGRAKLHGRNFIRVAPIRTPAMTLFNLLWWSVYNSCMNVAPF